ncbi:MULTISPECIES: hypothetical protein [unclassified Sulfurospirillum]|uniref:hypothetical protein n=1 Tax=Sulfurospirillum sp. SCADC TaxID=1537915 RepID=UPI0025EEF0F9|nr:MULTISPECIES: hypothetical protein [unclassified Sulfurospirillum]
MEYTLLKSALWGNKTQKMLAFLTIFLVSILVASMLNITLGIGDKVALELRSYGSNIIVLPKGGALGIEIEGKTIILITHNPELGRYADRIIHLRHGKMEEAPHA